MTLDTTEVQARLTGNLPGARIELSDMRGDGRFLSIRIEDDSLTELPVLEKYRRVLTLLKPLNLQSVHLKIM